MLKHSRSKPFPLIIIGAGPAAYTASIYASRAQIEHIIISGNVKGGQLVLSPEIENFPGFPSISGFDLMQSIETHAVKLGAEIALDYIEAVDFSSKPLVLKGRNTTYYASAVIIATGARYQAINLPGEEELLGNGVSYCAVCDGAFYKKQDVAVVGGGNTALEEALHLATLATKVFLIHRRDALRADQVLQTKVMGEPNIQILWNTTIEALHSDKEGLCGLTVKNATTSATTNLDLSALFVAIGTQPCTEFLQNQVQLDKKGYILTQPRSTQTSVPGVFAAGDVQEPVFKQAIISAGSGSMAGIEAARYLRLNNLVSSS